MNRLLILDLDETLIHTTREWIGYSPDFTCEGHGFIFIRPGFSEFIAEIRSYFDVAVWTAGTKDYLECVTSNLFRNVNLSFAWCRDHCVVDTYSNGDPLFLKELNKIERKGYNLRNVLAIDDRPEALKNYPDNLISIKPFYGDREDSELAELANYLKQKVKSNSGQND